MIQKELCVLLILQLTCNCFGAEGGAPYLVLYSEYDQNGDHIIIKSAENNLATFGFNDRTKSYCGSGLWFLFADYYFRDKSEFVEEFAGAGKTCQNVASTHANKITSVRYAGTDDVSLDSLTMYEHYNMAGGEFLVMRDVSDLGVFHNKATSFAVTGQTSWTIYSDYGYTGTSFCLQPTRSANGYLYGIWGPGDVPLGNDAICSVRKGCHSLTILRYAQPQ